MDPIPFHVPSIDEEDIPGVVQVLRERWVTTGARCRDFESAFAEYLAEQSGREFHCVAVNSCTAALHLALEAVGISRGDLVLTPSYTFTASAEVVRYLGAHPEFVDNAEGELQVSAARFMKHYRAMPSEKRNKVKAVLPVHYGGAPVEMEQLEEFCRAEGLALVDDAAHALPTRRKGKLIGCFGDVSAFSFYATKTLCTGEGGMAVTADAEIAQRLKTMRLHGISKDVFDRYRKTSSWYYEVVAPGFKYNMSDIMAALGLSQLRRIDAFRERRAEIAAGYQRLFENVDGLTLPPDAESGDLHAWHLYALRVAGGREVRDALIDLLGKVGIGTSVHFIPLHRQPYWRDTYRLREEDFPHAETLFASQISLPIYPALSNDQIERVASEVAKNLPAAQAPHTR
jgi:dTDP-4-amino-4,6-dideoxygalactose transaminase